MKKRYRILYLMIAVFLFFHSSLISFATINDMELDVYLNNEGAMDGDTSSMEMEEDTEANDEIGAGEAEGGVDVEEDIDYESPAINESRLSMEEMEEEEQETDVSVDNYNDLKAKINSAPTTASGNEKPYVIEIKGNIDNFGAAITIPYGSIILIRSGGGGSYVLTKSATARHFTVKGELILGNVVLDGNNAQKTATATTGGVEISNTKVKMADGTEVTEGGKLVMKDGAVIRNCYNASTSSTGGGGVQVTANGVFEMNGGEIRDNYSYYGGGVNSTATVTMNGGTISNNEATYGGGLYGNASSKIAVTGGGVNHNKATVGGGICIGPNDSGTPLTISGGTISHNMASDKGGGIGITGNTANSMTHSIQIVNGSKISNNVAGTNGGGVYSYYKGTIEIEDSVISGNTAGTSGGGIYGDAGSRTGSITINGSTITNNVAKDGSGGGVYGSGHTMNTKESLYRHNEAGNIGGGICMISTIGTPGVPSKDTVSGTSIINASRISSLTIGEGTEILHNTAINGGGIGVNSRMYEGSNCTATSTVTMNGGTIADNKATNGGGVYGVSDSRRNDNSLSGGVSKCNINVQGGIITRNEAVNGGGIFGDSMVSANGANESFSNINVEENAKITDNEALKNGGGIYSMNSGGTNVSRDKSYSGISINGGVINGNFAKGDGGALYGAGHSQNYTNTVSVNNGEIGDNKAEGNGGGIYAGTYGRISIIDGRIIGNAAPNGDGGGIYTSSANYTNLNVNNGTIFNNNMAASLYAPPINASATYSSIAAASVSISFAEMGRDDHPLNNYDVNYNNGDEYHLIAYDANGGVGTVTSQLVKRNQDATLNNGKGLQYGRRTLSGWSVEPNGDIEYELGGTIANVTENVTLYAVWEGRSEEPTINRIGEGDGVISGTGKPGAEIVATLPNGDTANTIVDENGNWSVTVPQGNELKVGDKVSVMQKEDGLDPSGEVEATVESSVIKEQPEEPQEEDQEKAQENPPLEPSEESPINTVKDEILTNEGDITKEEKDKEGNLGNGNAILHTIHKYFNKNGTNGTDDVTAVQTLQDSAGDGANGTNCTCINNESESCGKDEGMTSQICNCNGSSDAIIAGCHYGLLILILLILLVLIGITLIILVSVGMKKIKKLKNEDSSKE